MKNKRWHLLESAKSFKGAEIYGKPQWEARFRPAEWSHLVGGLSRGRLGLTIEEPRFDLTIVLPSPRIGDFVWTWYNDCIVTESTLSLFTEAGFTGFSSRPVTVERVRGIGPKRKNKRSIPPLWELVIKGRGGDAHPDSGIRVIGKNGKTGELRYSSFHDGILVDEANWDGSDFCTVNGYPKHILVTERVKELIVERQLTNCTLIPSHELRWGHDDRPEDTFEEHQAMAARDLDSLLADLDSTDKSAEYMAVYALGDKGDPGAVDALLAKLDDPGIGENAAAAVASIIDNKTLPPDTREQIFSKLCAFLDHENPEARRSVARGLSCIGDDRSLSAMMKLLEDPNDEVRSFAVFLMGVHRYNPAVDIVRRAKRDRSKRVRDTVRMILPEIEAELIWQERNKGDSAPS